MVILKIRGRPGIEPEDLVILIERGLQKDFAGGERRDVPCRALWVEQGGARRGYCSQDEEEKNLPDYL